MLGPDEVDDVLMSALGGSALFAAHFRENAARALLLPRRRPGQRTPLWMQRQRSADLLTVASRYGSFPIILETYREILSDVFDVPALEGGAGRDPLARHPRVPRSRRGRPRRSRPGCCSTTSAPTCTRATRRWPSAARRHCPSTASCWPSCSARRSCASCSTRPPPPTWSWSCRRWPAAGGCGRWTGCTTCCGASATCGPTRWQRARDLPEVEVALSGLGEGPAHRRAAAGGRGAMDRDRGRGPLPRRLRRQPAARRGARRGCRPRTATSTPPLDALLLRWARTHSPVHRGRAGGTLGDRPVPRPGAPPRPGRAGRPAGGRLPARRHRARVRRPRRAARPAPPLAGAPAARGRAGVLPMRSAASWWPGTASGRRRPATTGCWR